MLNLKDPTLLRQQVFLAGEWADADEIAVFGSQPVAFLGTAHARARELIPGRLLNPIEIQQILLNAPVNATFCETTP